MSDPGDELFHHADYPEGFIENQQKKCPVCGETDPYPAWFCLPRAVGQAVKDQPCSYSKEGHARMGERAEQKLAARKKRDALT